MQTAARVHTPVKLPGTCPANLPCGHKGGDGDSEVMGQEQQDAGNTGTGPPQVFSQPGIRNRVVEWGRLLQTQHWANPQPPGIKLHRCVYCIGTAVYRCIGIHVYRCTETLVCRSRGTSVCRCMFSCGSADTLQPCRGSLGTAELPGMQPPTPAVGLSTVLHTNGG